jgi:hypothetical protein
MSTADWITANQRVLVAEFARLRARIAGETAPALLEELAAARQAMTTPAAIDVLSEAFELTPFERDVLLLCAGIAMDSGLARCVQCASGAATPQASFGLALQWLEGAHWSALTPVRPLRCMGLIYVHDERALTTCRLSVEERVLHYLSGVNYLDPRLRSLLRESAGCRALAACHETVVSEAIAALESGVTPTMVQLIGDDAAAQHEIAFRIAAHYGSGLRSLSVGELPVDRLALDTLATLWNRESVLLGSAMLVRAVDSEIVAAARFMERLGGLVFFAAPVPASLGRVPQFTVRRPGSREQEQLWRKLLGDIAPQINGSIDAVATQFRLATSEIVHTARELRAAASPPAQLDGLLWRACRESARRSLDDLAQHIVPTADWQDLVLPDQQLATLRQIAACARHRLTVHERWGFAAKSTRGLGISVLFSGESGTGKTMAAEVLANDLRLDLFRIDLSSMVSKYIGETEKNLRRLFDAAELSGAILLFDEADALFGKRSEVKDSHDRYANIEVSYLLQRMEAYRGLAILTTNLKGAIDPAFQRRLQFVVQFPFPDADLRERIWHGVFPTAAPLAEIDAAKLAQLSVAGGSIRNIALNAAFLAADCGEAVGMRHLLQAARSEATKRERPFSDGEVRGWI